MSLWIRSVGDGTIAVCRNNNSLANVVGYLIDHPCDLARTVVYNHDCTEILGDVHSANMDDAMDVLKRAIA